MGSGVIAQSSHLLKGKGNPLLPGYFADPTVKKFGDTFYIYATTDGNGGGFGPSQVWTSKDFVNWTFQDMNWPTTHHYWAPDVTQGADGKYYLYYCQPVEIFGASSETPIGPWTSLLPPGKPIVPNFLVPNVITLDGQTFKDDDGKYYMYWGTWGIYPNHGCGVGLLNDDMKSFAKLAQIPNTDAKDFFEAPFVFKRKGIYYLTYSSGYCEDGTYRVQYATASNPMGPFKYGTNNPILATNADGTVHGPGHQSVLQQGDDFYLVYHRHNNPHNDGGYHRQVAADKMIFDEQGNILKLEPSHSGIGYLAKNANPHPNLTLGKKTIASSFYDANFKPEYATDDNNGTLWKANNNVGPAWLQIDLGKEQDIRSVHTQFEYATWYYQYKIESSLDGKIWKLYADRSRNTKHGSPMIDFGNVKARYLRITILHTEYPGLNKALWNIKVFDNSSYHPVANTVSKQWQSLETFQSKGLLVDLDLSQLRLGSVADVLPNTGNLAGSFKANGAHQPVVKMIDGKKALVFSGRERLESSMKAPMSLMGNSSYSVSMWVLNPEIEKEELIASWTSRGGDNLTNLAVGYGSSKSSGAAVHAGWADLGFKNLPKAGQWHFITMVFDGTMERIYVDGKPDRAERRMLFVKNLKHFLIGGNEDGTSGFSGALAGLKIYDYPLTAKKITDDHFKGISNPVSVFLDVTTLNYGDFDTWKNNGALGGELAVEGKAKVMDVKGKIAAVLTNETKLRFSGNITDNLHQSEAFSAILSLCSSPGAKTDLHFGQKVSFRITGTGEWQQVIFSYDNGKPWLFINGRLEKIQKINKQQKDLRNFLVAVSGETAVSNLEILDNALSASASTGEYRFWKQTIGKPNATATLDTESRAMTPNLLFMSANKPDLPGTRFEYYLTNEGDDDSEGRWIESANFFNFAVEPNRSYTYSVKARDNYGNVTLMSKPVTVRTDTFLFVVKKQSGSMHATVVNPAVFSGTSWDGLLGKADTIIQQAGVLKMVSHNSTWDGTKETGPFAYQLIKGDFVAEVELADMIGLLQKKAYGANETGLMVKAADENRKFVQNGIMPGWGVGNIVTNFDSGDRKQTNNMSGWSFYRHLQIQKLGNTFFLRGSNDGKHWFELPGSPMKRPDLENVPLQVGVYHASYGEAAGYGAFKNFKLIQRK
ncbi:hypothetical protein ASF92_02505 [Pedobacter sp. Leaf176]|nr:hypothetical protein ASF92_02505 [Pedobacter sp. Leaf176]